MSKRVAVQLAAFDEAPTELRQTLDAYARQDVPRGVTLAHEVAVTPADGSSLAEVRAHPVFQAVETPPGKLTSRNEIHARAVQRGDDVIVVGDADATPDSSDYLARLLEPFDRSDVVAVNGHTEPTGLGASLMRAVYRADQAVNRPLYGRHSAFRTAAWTRAGPFDTDGLDETDDINVRHEEEFAFRSRLEEVGAVVEARDARCQHDQRRVFCKVFGSIPFHEPRRDFCQRMGSETFAPHRNHK